MSTCTKFILKIVCASIFISSFLVVQAFGVMNNATSANYKDCINKISGSGDGGAGTRTGDYGWFYRDSRGKMWRMELKNELLSNNEAITWVCAAKYFRDPGTTWCSMWMSQNVGSPKQEIRINEKHIIGKDERDLFNFKVTVALNGTCLESSIGAKDIHMVQGGDYLNLGGLSYLQRSACQLRGKCSISGQPIVDGLDVGKFIEKADMNEKDGIVEYTAIAVIERTNAQTDGSSREEEIPIIVTIEPYFAAQSNVAARKGDGDDSFESTKLVRTFASAKDTERVKVGDTVKVIFSHNIYDSAKRKNIEWRRRQGMDSKTNGYMILNGAEGECKYNGMTEGKVDFVERFGFLYTPAGRTCDDGQNKYITRDVYDIKFTEEGTYRFCEFITLAGNELTEVCAVIIVGEGEEEPVVGGECTFEEPTFEASGRYQGWTSVKSGVTSTSMGDGEWGMSNSNFKARTPYESRDFNESPAYAKPGDDITWQHCYYPGVIKTVNTKVLYEGKGNIWETCPKETIVAEVIGWDIESNAIRENQYNVDLGNTDVDVKIGSQSGMFSVKTMDAKSFTSVMKEVGAEPYTSKTGEVLFQGIQSGSPREIELEYEEPSGEYAEYLNEECPGVNGSFVKDGSVKMEDGSFQDSAEVQIPYNFKARSSPSIVDDKDELFAGETVSIGGDEDKQTKLYVHIDTNRNNLGTYSTKADKVNAWLIAYTATEDVKKDDYTIESQYETLEDLCGRLEKRQADGPCVSLKELNGKTMNYTNGKESLTGWSSKKQTGDEVEGKDEEGNIFDGNFGGTYNVFDVPAGTWYCVSMAIYPAKTIGNDIKIGKQAPWAHADGRQYYSWYVSKPSCRVIAKKPSLQVWGAGMYTGGKIGLVNAEKRVVADAFQDYKPKDTGEIIFGSWVEQNIIANGKIEALASGASTGGPGITDRTKDGIGGSFSGNDICILSPLTMPNNNCKSKFAGIDNTSSPGLKNSMNAPNDKEAIVARFMKEAVGFELHRDCALSGLPSFDANKTHAYNCDGDFTIGADINYSDRNTYNSLADIPKIIIYATGDISIECNVGRIDAVLIADGMVDTCSDEDDDNSKKRSNQLKINGAVITNKMDAKRTYGAGPGTESESRGGGSEVPAEIVNYDTSLYLWGSNKADVSSSGKLETTYQTELAPRL